MNKNAKEVVQDGPKGHHFKKARSSSLLHDLVNSVADTFPHAYVVPVLFQIHMGCW